MSNSPWMNRDLDSNFAKGRPPQENSASFTIGGGNNFYSPQPVPPPVRRQAVFGKPQPPRRMSVDENLPLPSTLCESRGTLITYEVI